MSSYVYCFLCLVAGWIGGDLILDLPALDSFAVIFGMAVALFAHFLIWKANE